MKNIWALSRAKLHCIQFQFQAFRTFWANAS